MLSQEHIEWRRNGIGGSDAPVIAGVSPWKTPLQLWEEKALGIYNDTDSKAKKRGRDLEEEGLRAFEKKTGIFVAPDRYINPNFSWIRVSMDGADLSGRYAVEVKHPNKEDHEMAKYGKIPNKYVPQCHHYLLAKPSLKNIFYFSRYEYKEGVFDEALVEVNRDESILDPLFNLEEKFWDMVLNKVQPEMTDRDFLNMEDCKKWKREAASLIKVKEQLKALEERESELLQTLKSLTQGRSGKGNGLSLQRSICMGGVDYAKIPELLHVDLNVYRKKPFEKWTSRVMKKNEKSI